MAIAPPLFGFIYDKAGSYVPVYWILVVGAAAGSLIYLVLGPYRYKATIGLAVAEEGAPGAASETGGAGPAPSLTATPAQT